MEPPVATNNFGVDRRTRVRVKNFPEATAKSTTFPEENVTDGGSLTRKEIGIRPRPLQQSEATNGLLDPVRSTPY